MRCGLSNSTDVPISVVVSIGPGLPTSADVERITRGCSRGLDIIADYRAMSIEVSRIRNEESSNKTSGSIAPPDVVKQDVNIILPRPPNNTASQSSASTPLPYTEKRDSISQTNSTGSIKGGSLDAQLKQREDEVDQAIKSKLDKFYPLDPKLCYRLAPTCAVQGSVKDDPEGVVLEAIKDFLNEPGTHNSIEDVVQRLT